MRYAALSVILALLPPRQGAAATVSVVLAPGDGTVAFRAYGVGLLPLDGQFTRFRGQLSYDPDNHADCSVSLLVDVASLAMGSQTVGETVLGPDFLDAARFPTLAYDGACSAGGLSGWLTMHGVTQPFTLTLDWTPGSLLGAGHLRRADWRMTAMPVAVGSTVRITVTVPLAAGIGHGRPPGADR